MGYLEIFYFIFYLSILSACIAVALSLRKELDTPFKLIRLLLLCSITFDLTGNILNFLFSYSIPYRGVLYRLIEFIILIQFYKLSLHRKSSWILFLQFAIPAILIGLFGLSSTPFRILNSIIFTLCGIYYFYTILRDMHDEQLLKKPLFWCNVAFLVYFTGSLFLFLIFDPLAKNNEASAVLSYSFHNILAIGKNILLAYAFWLWGNKESTIKTMLSTSDKSSPTNGRK